MRANVVIPLDSARPPAPEPPPSPLTPNPGSLPGYLGTLHRYSALVQRHEHLDESADLSEDDFELHRILAKMAALHEAGGFGLERSARKAYDLYSQAAEVAEEMMKSKLASKYYEKVPAPRTFLTHQCSNPNLPTLHPTATAEYAPQHLSTKVLRLSN